MPPTLLDLITEIMVGCGELAQGETPSPEDSAWIFSKGNELLDSWSTERLSIYEIQEILLNLSNKQSFTIGIGATDFNQTRPVVIEACTIVNLINGSPVRVRHCEVIGERRWREIADLAATSNVPEMMYPDQAFPVETLNFYPIPLCAQATGALLSVWLPLQQFVALTDEFAMPNGYQKAFVDGLTVVILKSYGHAIGQDDAAMEQSSKARIQQLNSALPDVGISGFIPAPQGPPQ